MANSYKVGETDTRPWGQWWCLDVMDTTAVKRILVKPGGILSLQVHQHRDEHWIISQGTAQVTVGEEKITLKKNESVFIPKKTVHRIENIGTEDVYFIEVQIGDILSEDDIERLEDTYGRT